MTGETTPRALLLAKTLESILKKRFSTPVEGKSMVCLEGFPADVFQVLKENYGGGAGIYWASEEQGPQLVRLRNDDKLKNPLVIFSDAYFAESQSLAHIGRITDNMLLQDKQYVEVLVETALKKKFNNGIKKEVIDEAVQNIIAIIKPSLEELADYLVKVAAAPGNIDDSMGTALWLLGVFSHRNLVSKNIIKGSKTKTKNRLQKKFEYQLKNNVKYSRAAYRTRFTVKRINEATHLDKNQKKLLFDYARGINIPGCYQQIDFENIKKLISRRSPDPEKKSQSLEALEENDDILPEIARIFNKEGTYHCRIGKESPFDIDIKRISRKELFRPIEGFKVWMDRLESELKKIDNAERDEDEYLEISIKLIDDNNYHVFSLPDPLKYRKDYSLEALSILEVSKKSNEGKLIKAAEDFAWNREKIPVFISSPVSITLDIDIEEYVGSYLELLIILWENATRWAHQTWFHELLKKLVTLDLKIKDNEAEVKAAHPFALFRRRLIEAMALELMENKTIGEEPDDEDDSLFEDIYKEAETHFSKSWPRYLALQDSNDPLYIDHLKQQLIYRRPPYYNRRKPTLERQLNPEILSYIKQNPLTGHTFFLKVLNPLDGEELFNALQRLFQQREKDNVPESIFLKAMGPKDGGENIPETLSSFDLQAESRDQKQGEMFLIPPDRLHPFCRYEKELEEKGDDCWLYEWIKKNSVVDSSKKDIADIFIAMDPFLEKHRVIDNFMPPGISAAIDAYFRDFKKSKKIMEFLTGPDRIYVRLAFEALSIMVLKRGAERRNYVPAWMDTGKYMELIKCMKDKGQWKMVIDNNLSDYFAEKLETVIEESGEKVSTILYESSTGTNYLFITPPRENPDIFPDRWEWLPAEIRDNHGFQEWLETMYKELIKNEQYCRELFAHDCQWMIPLRYFPDWLIRFLVEDKEYDEEIITESQETYSLRFQFKIEGDTIYYDAKLKKNLKDNKCQTIENKKMDMSFLNCDKPVMMANYCLLDNLKRREFSNVLMTFCTNPYQAWFLALLKREEMKAIEKGKLFEYDTAGVKNISPGKIAVWRLRMLMVYIIKFYARHQGISHDDRHTIMTLFEKIKEGCPGFQGDLVEHLEVFYKQNKRDLFGELFFLEKYKR